MEYGLGLDLGPNSVAFGCLTENQILDAGVRIFQEGVEAKTGTPKNQARRLARLARRNINRRAQRRDELLLLLEQNQLLPSGLLKEGENSSIWNQVGDPWLLRAKALDEKLKPEELSRVFLHMCKRRGFQSNRKSASDDEGRVLSAITALQAEITKSNCRTLGEYLCSKKIKRNRNWIKEADEAELFTLRKMHKDEFELIWNTQTAYYPKLLNSVFKVKVYKAIFFQRPLASQSAFVGDCTFEHHRKRAPICYLESQRVRLWQEIHNLQIKDPARLTYRNLDPQEKNLLYAFLDERTDATWTQMRKILSLHENEIFSLEEKERPKLKGNTTHAKLKKVMGPKLASLSLQQQDDLVVDLYTIEDEAALLSRAVNQWAFSPEIAENLAKLRLENGYSRLSLKALKKLLPHLAMGLNYHDACQAVGYKRKDQIEQVGLDFLPEPPHLRNPIVQKGLFQVRRVVNALIKKHGKPSYIRIEMARDMKLTKKEKDDLSRKQNLQERENSQTEEILKNDFKISSPSRDDIIKYKLWKECGMMCPYTGQIISRDDLFSGAYQVEHILPWSRSFDDSFANKTLCAAGHNQHVKKNQTPHEAYSGDPETFEKMLIRVRRSNMSPSKKKKFELPEIPEGFVSRQLNDTRYICTEVRKYLELLYTTDSQNKQIKVQVSKGGMTAALRQAWNLNTLLSEDGKKNRADHRHHAIDAIVIAATTSRTVQLLSQLSERISSEGIATGLWDRAIQRKIPIPWIDFRKHLGDRINSMIVSHTPCRAIQGALHAATAFGPTAQKDVYAFRRPLNKITLKNVVEIRDPKVRSLIQERLEKYSGDGKEAFSTPLFHSDGKTPIRKVRVGLNYEPSSLLELKRNHKPYRYHEFANNHHVEIIRDVKTGKWSGVYVTALVAAQRAKTRQPVAKRDHGPAKEFIMDLAINDLIQLHENGEIYLCRVQKMTEGKIMFREHWLSRIDGPYEKVGRFITTPNSLQNYKPQKIQVSPSGDISTTTRIAYD